MLIFVFLGKGLGINSPAHFVYDFSTEMFLMLHSTNRSNFIVWLTLLFETFGQYVYCNCLLTRLRRHKCQN